MTRPRQQTIEGSLGKPRTRAPQVRRKSQNPTPNPSSPTTASTALRRASGKLNFGPSTSSDRTAQVDTSVAAVKSVGDEDENEDEDGNGELELTKRKQESKFSKRRKIDVLSDEEEEDMVVELEESKRKFSLSKRSNYVVVSDDDDDALSLHPLHAPKADAKELANRKDSSKVQRTLKSAGQIKVASQYGQDDEQDDEDDDDVISRKTKKRIPNKRCYSSSGGSDAELGRRPMSPPARHIGSCRVSSTRSPSPRDASLRRRSAVGCKPGPDGVARPRTFGRRRVVLSDSESEKDHENEVADGDDDQVIFSPGADPHHGIPDPSAFSQTPKHMAAKRRHLVPLGALSPPAGHTRASYVSRRKTPPARPIGSERESVIRPATLARKAVRKTPTGRQRSMSILKKRRERRDNGTAILDDEEEVQDMEEESDRPALYDRDRTGQFLALENFDDDSEGVPDEEFELDAGASQAGDGGTQGSADNDDDNGDQNGDDGDPLSGGSVEEDSDESENADIIEDGSAPVDLRDALAGTSMHIMTKNEAFRYCIEWMTIRVLFPHDLEVRQFPIYVQALGRTEDEVGTYATSKFFSSIWRSDFSNALRARPTMHSTELGNYLETENCGACGRSAHPARFRVKFEGSIYHRATGRYRIVKCMDRVPQDADEDDEDDDEDEDEDNNDNNSAEKEESSSDGECFEYDEDGRPVDDESREWLVGSTCHANAEMAHMLTHWKYSLFEWVQERLESEGRMQPAADFEATLVASGDTTDNQHLTRQSYVVNIIATWENDSTIDALHRSFMASLAEAARATSNSRQRTHPAGL